MIAILVTLLFIASEALLVVGVYMLVGLGWALIAAAVMCGILAAIIARGNAAWVML